ncbi:MAG: hypothetical protein RML46_03870 [Anaerolineae bacterium]|nr:hypothetical protein [Anaerolineae bacterium]MDW8068030.1 hypothetical protein [Anaerolineae bacterium]
MVVYVECKPDVVLLQNLGFPCESIQHLRVFGRGKALKGLASGQGNRVLAGEDPLSAQPRMFSGLPIQELPQYRLKIVQRGQNRLILLCPRLEEWLLWLAKQAGVDPQRYGLPKNSRELHKVINKRLDNLEKLLESLKKHPKSGEILLKLRDVLQ